MIQDEYLRFLQTLATDEVSDDVRKIANLVLQHLDELIPLSTAQGNRAKKIVELAQANWGILSSDIQSLSNQRTEQSTQINRLKSLSVGSFRGFAKKENFDLDGRLVLCYGPNGSGKSSFCEALEYCLLGCIAEAESRRFQNQKDYMKNAYINAFEPPEMIGIDIQGNCISIRANESIYRFCFVEKNRINSFSRIASLTPAKQTEMISTLFGLDAFSEFVRNFTTEIDNRYIDLEGIKAEQLNKKRSVLIGFQQQIEYLPNELKRLDGEELALAHRYKKDATFDQMVKEINGDGEILA